MKALHRSLCDFQSAFWHDLLQYLTALQLLHAWTSALLQMMQRLASMLEVEGKSPLGLCRGKVPNEEKARYSRIPRG